MGRVPAPVVHARSGLWLRPALAVPLCGHLAAAGERAGSAPLPRALKPDASPRAPALACPALPTQIYYLLAAIVLRHPFPFYMGPLLVGGLLYFHAGVSLDYLRRLTFIMERRVVRRALARSCLALRAS